MQPISVSGPRNRAAWFSWRCWLLRLLAFLRAIREAARLARVFPVRLSLLWFPGLEDWFSGLWLPRDFDFVARARVTKMPEAARVRRVVFFFS